jgi:hypothetical protein
VGIAQSGTPTFQASPRLPWGSLCFGAIVASIAVGGSFAPVDPERQDAPSTASSAGRFASKESKYADRDAKDLRLLRIQANRRALLEEDEANACKEFLIVTEKLRKEDTRLMMLTLDAQLKEMQDKMANVQDKMANVTFDGESYAKKLPGVLPLLGYFDPLGLASKIGESEEKVNFYREAELKHGRLGTLAAMGIVVSENFHPFGGDQMNGVPAILAFQNEQMLWGTALILATIALPDIKAVPLLSPTDRMKQTTELNGTRVGMLAATSMIAKEMAESTCLSCSLKTLAVAAPEAAVVSQAAAVSTALVEAI